MMAISPALRKSLITAAGGGALAIAAVLIPNLEGNSYTPYRDVGGVWTVCNGITGPDVIQGKTYTQKECDALLQKHLRPYARSVERSVRCHRMHIRKPLLSVLAITSVLMHSSTHRYCATLMQVAISKPAMAFAVGYMLIA